MNHVARNVGQSEVATGVTKGQRLMIQAQKVEDGRVEVVDVNLLLSDGTSVIIARSVADSRTYPCTCHPG